MVTPSHTPVLAPAGHWCCRPEGVIAVFWTVAFWVLLPFLVLLLVMGTIAAVVRRRRYQPTADDWQDWSDRASRQQRGDDRFGSSGGGGGW